MSKYQSDIELARLEALKRYEILDTAPESDFDDLVRLAAKIFDLPISTVTIVDADRQWFKASIGLNINETARDISFCTHAIELYEPLVVNNTAEDPRFASNPLVINNPSLGFYAGVPLRNSNDFVLGTFCIMGQKPREFTADELETLKILANQAMRLLDLRAERNKLRDLNKEIERINTDLSESEQRWKFALEGAGDGVWDWDIKTQQVFFSSRWKNMLGYDDHEIANKREAWISLIHQDDLSLVLDGLDSYLNKKLDHYEIEYRLLCKDNSWKWVLSRGMVVEWDENGSPKRMVGTHTDISERKKSEETIWKQANFDTLTGLPNRRMFFYRLKEEIKRASRNQSQFALMFLDLDGFKEVNDQYGHLAGDMVLTESTKRIKLAIRESDTFARLGGDEFTIIMSLKDDLESFKTVAQNIINTFRLPFLQVGTTCRVSVSIGIAIFPLHGNEADLLLSRADKAMYEAKASGKSTWFQYPFDLNLLIRSSNPDNLSDI